MKIRLSIIAMTALILLIGSMYQTLKYVPKALGVFGFAAAGLVWVLLPFFDWKSNRGEFNRLYTIIGLFAVIYVVVFTIIGYVAPGE